MKNQIDNVMVTITVFEAMSGDLVKAGFDLITQTAVEQEDSAKRYQQNNSVVNQKVLAYGYPGLLWQDLNKLGYILTNAHILKKDNNKIQLRLLWTLNSTSPPPKFTSPQISVIVKYLNQSYWKIFEHYYAVCDANEKFPVNGSVAVLNCSGLMNRKDRAQFASSIQAVRCTDTGSLPGFLPQIKATAPDYYTRFQIPPAAADNLERAFQ